MGERHECLAIHTRLALDTLMLSLSAMDAPEDRIGEVH